MNNSICGKKVMLQFESMSQLVRYVHVENHTYQGVV